MDNKTKNYNVSHRMLKPSKYFYNYNKLSPATACKRESKSSYFISNRTALFELKSIVS